ncbi:TIGR00295 family protein [Candidatus Bathyarchaeota archaeon]|nr:TIGR00295 family protein [Candidatus Bathyarchaeota archaeon]
MALSLLSKSGCSEKVILHCKSVSFLAEKFARICESKGLGVDVNLVKIGALLHDIGRSKTHDINHAVVGVEIAKSLDLPELVVCIIERHIGGGISAEEAKELDLPIKDYFPVTLEEKIVSYADKLIEGSRVVTIEHTIQHLSKKLGVNHPAINHVIMLHEELLPLIGDSNADNHSS